MVEERNNEHSINRAMQLSLAIIIFNLTLRFSFLCFITGSAITLLIQV